MQAAPSRIKPIVLVHVTYGKIVNEINCSINTMGKK